MGRRSAQIGRQRQPRSTALVDKIDIHAITNLVALSRVYKLGFVVSVSTKGAHMFAVTYRVTLHYYVYLPDGSPVFREQCLSRRVFLAAKPAVGETLSVPFFDKKTPTRFVVVDVEHYTYVDSPQALSYVPEYLGEVFLVAHGHLHGQHHGATSYSEGGDRCDRCANLLSDITSLGWSIDEHKS